MHGVARFAAFYPLGGVHSERVGRTSVLLTGNGGGLGHEQKVSVGNSKIDPRAVSQSFGVLRIRVWASEQGTLGGPISEQLLALQSHETVEDRHVKIALFKDELA